VFGIVIFFCFNGRFQAWEHRGLIAEKEQNFTLAAESYVAASACGGLLCNHLAVTMLRGRLKIKARRVWASSLPPTTSNAKVTTRVSMRAMLYVFWCFAAECS
jgi:hypothetical protein